MRGYSLLFSVWILVLVYLLPNFVSAQQTTNDFGITIGPEELTDAIQQTQDFWGPVLRHISSAEFAQGEVEQHRKAADFLKKVHDSLHHRLFEEDEQAAIDLMNYLGMRLRKFVVYRQLREVVANDALLPRLIDTWETLQRGIHLLPEDQQASAEESGLTQILEEMRTLGLSAEKCEQSKPLWKLHAQCVSAACETEAGKMMLRYEQEIRQQNPEVATLIHHIAAAADWAVIKVAPNHELGKKDFLVAWEEITKMREENQAANGKKTSRK